MIRSALLCLILAALSLGSLSACAPTEEGRITGECGDGLDNDEDGAIDCEDLGCLGDYDCVSAGDDDSAL